MADIYSFEKLTAYQEARKLVKKTYTLTKFFPEEEKYGLTSQVRRAIVSVASNLAEGSGRISIKDKVRFMEISFSSLMESICQLTLAQDLGYISLSQLNDVKEDILRVSIMINGLRNYSNSKI